MKNGLYRHNQHKSFLGLKTRIEIMLVWGWSRLLVRESQANRTDLGCVLPPVQVQMDPHERASARDCTHCYAHIRTEAERTPSVAMVEVGRLLNGAILTHATLCLFRSLDRNPALCPVISTPTTYSQSTFNFTGHLNKVVHFPKSLLT